MCKLQSFFGLEFYLCPICSVLSVRKLTPTNTAATNLRPEFRRYGSCKIDGFINSFPSLNYVAIEPDEHSRLLNHISSSGSASTPPYDNTTPSWTLNNSLQIVWATVASSAINWLLIFVPLGIVAGAVGSSPTLVFLLNFLAIIPLASLLSFATEELSEKLGSALGGLVNATFGNAVEMIVRLARPMIQVLRADYVRCRSA
jgi:hypothetical protein